MKTAIKSLILLALIASFSTAARASVVYIQPHNGSGSLYQSALNGTDYDQLTWDMFRVTNSIAITEIRWRGGYLYGGAYSGRATNWTIAVYRDIANGFEPDIISPPFAIYSVSATPARLWQARLPARRFTTTPSRSRVHSRPRPAPITGC